MKKPRRAETKKSGQMADSCRVREKVIMPSREKM